MVQGSFHGSCVFFYDLVIQRNAEFVHFLASVFELKKNIKAQQTPAILFRFSRLFPLIPATRIFVSSLFRSPFIRLKQFYASPYLF